MRIFFDQTKVDALFVCGREQRGEANANALLADHTSNGEGDFAQEAKTVLQRTAIFIITLVGMGRNELVYQVPVRAVKLHPVKTCFQSISGCLGVELNQFLYLLGGQGSWGRRVGQCTRAGASFDEHLDVVRADG